MDELREKIFDILCEAVQNYRVVDIDEEVSKILALLSPQWISVEDRLPEHDQEVMTYSATNNSMPSSMLMGITRYTKQENTSYFYGGNPGDGYKVTHWMPLPQPPKEGD
jgi:hypothetical protein